MRPYRTPGSPQAVPLELARQLQRQAQEARQEAERAQREAAEAHRMADRLRAELAEAQQAPPEPPSAPEPAPDADRVLRLQADLANLRRHRDEAVARARQEGLGEGLAAVADSYAALQRALAPMPADEAMSTGLRGLLRQLGAAVERAGATLVGEPGEPFDPHRHEAVGTDPTAEAGVVAHVEQVGLQVGERLVRPARVVLGA